MQCARRAVLLDPFDGQGTGDEPGVALPDGLVARRAVVPPVEVAADPTPATPFEVLVNDIAVPGFPTQEIIHGNVMQGRHPVLSDLRLKLFGRVEIMSGAICIKVIVDRLLEMSGPRASLHPFLKTVKYGRRYPDGHFVLPKAF